MKFWKSKLSHNRFRQNRVRLASFEQLENRRLLAVDLAPPDMIARPYVFIGDHSGSNSEIWSMQVGSQTIAAPDYGVVQREQLSLVKGQSYLVSVSHGGTNREHGPDYDYRAWIDSSANPAWTSGSSTPSGKDFFVDNSSGLLQRQFFGDDTNEATGTATVHVPLVDLDIDSNNNGSFDSEDDWLELDSKTGRLVDVLNGDIDQDGIVDRIDFNGIEGASFEPIKLSLSSNLQHAGYSHFEITFTYSMASPNAASSGGDFRLWKVDAAENRTDLSALIRTGQTISAESLGLSPGSSVTLYLEAVNASRNTVNFKEIKVDVAVSYGRFNGTLTDKIHASAVLPAENAVPEVISVFYKNESGNQIVAINEGAILPVSGSVKYRREVQSVEVAVWADLNFDGIKDSNEVATVQATRTSQSNLNGDRFYEFSTSFLVLDDGPSPGNGGGADSLTITATPVGGTAYDSFMIVQNVAPTWVDYPTLNGSYNENGIIESASISGIFRDPGFLDRHGVQVLVNGVVRNEQLIPESRVGFSIDIGVITPSDGERITVRLFDDDLGETTFYITLSTVVSKSFIANIYTANGAGTVRAAEPADQDYAMSATNRLLAFGAITAGTFRENPGPLTQDDFRLYSRDVYAVGFDGSSVQYFEHVTEGSVLLGGVEPSGYQGEIEAQNRYATQTSQVGGSAGLFVFGRPDPSLEGVFDAVMERTSTDIWYKLDVKFTMQGNFANFSVVSTDSSAFPSNRVWIDTTLRADYQQSTFVKLWQSSPILGGTFVVGRDESGIFERQYYLGEQFWVPVEN